MSIVNSCRKHALQSTMQQMRLSHASWGPHMCFLHSSQGPPFVEDHTLKVFKTSLNQLHHLHKPSSWQQHPHQPAAFSQLRCINTETHKTQEDSTATSGNTNNPVVVQLKLTKQPYSTAHGCKSPEELCAPDNNINLTARKCADIDYSTLTCQINAFQSICLLLSNAATNVTRTAMILCIMSCCCKLVCTLRNTLWLQHVRTTTNHV